MPLVHDWVRKASGTSHGTAHDALEAAKALSHIPVEAVLADAAQGCPPARARLPVNRLSP